MNTITADAAWLGVWPTGEEHKVSLEIGTPYPVNEEEWRCPVAVPGLHDKIIDIRGVDALQSLTLALRLAQTLLRHFAAEGGQLLDLQTRETISLNAYFPPEKREEA